MSKPDAIVVDWAEMGLGLITAMFALTGHPLGQVVGVNGVLCHGAYAVRLSTPYRLTFWWWDAVCNVCMCLYVNAHLCAQPLAAGITALALAAWVGNNLADEGPHPVVHATLIQLPLFVGLAYFISQC